MRALSACTDDSSPLASLPSDLISTCVLFLFLQPQVNSDPFGEGWFVKVKLADAAQLDGLMDAQAYTDFCK